MKRMSFIALLSFPATLALAQLSTNTFTSNPNELVPEGNPVGITDTLTVSGLEPIIENVEVTLDITGGFNGNLYAWLVSPGGNTAILLNRVGVSGVNSFGYANQGFNVTLSDGAGNIHNYQSLGYTLNASDQLTGIWAPDGRNISPLSSGAAFETAPTTANLGVFDGGDGNGTWTLFVADITTGGGDSTLASWGMTVVASPEPAPWTLIVVGVVGALAWHGLFCRRRFGR
jgi:subtilisin-like proprotein convertase family protein